MENIIVDKTDEHLLKEYRWRIHKQGYVVSSVNGSTIRLHHLVIGFPPSGLETDHINRNKLDNRRENLRHVTHQVNLMNREFKNKSGYKGVYFEKNRKTKPYKTCITRNGKRINLGYYATPELASQAVQEYISNE